MKLKQIRVHIAQLYRGAVSNTTKACEKVTLTAGPYGVLADDGVTDPFLFPWPNIQGAVVLRETKEELNETLSVVKARKTAQK